MARWEWQKKVWQPYFAPHFAQSAPYGREKCGKKSLPYFFFLFVARNGCHSFATKEEQKRTQTPLTMENNDDIIAFLLARDAILLFEALLNEVESDGKSNKPTTRRVFPRPNYKESTWWKMLEDGRCKTPGTREAKLFRRRFAVPFARFAEFCELAESWEKDDGRKLFGGKKDAVNVDAVPLELKVLGALRMISKGVAFDAIAELSGMSEQTMQAFFHVFFERFVAHFKDIWIKHPSTHAEVAESMEQFRRLGFPGMYPHRHPKSRHRHLCHRPWFQPRCRCFHSLCHPRRRHPDAGLRYSCPPLHSGLLRPRSGIWPLLHLSPLLLPAFLLLLPTLLGVFP